MRWDDVNARARGLATHLLDRDTVAGLAAAPDWPTFISRITALGYPLAGPAMVDPVAFDRAVSLVASRRLNLLGRWLSTRQGVLAVVLEDEERRTVRAMLRGAAQGASPGARLRAAMPTTYLPVGRLERLAHASSVPELVEDLVRAGHPAGRALQDVLRHAKVPNLQALEWALARLFSERATRAARPGGPVVRGFAAELVDQENVWTLLLAAPPEGGAPADRDFLLGGSRLTLTEFARLRAERDSQRLAQGLRVLFKGTALGVALAVDPLDMPAVALRAAAARIVWLHRLGRRDPLGPAVVLGVMERIRAEARALRSIAWGVSFGAPASTVLSLIPEAV
jgi:vacuolar-type H+-ATPase subunit C/Vma6